MYFLVSRGENPIRLFFSEKDAKEYGEEEFDAYLDVFDAQGNKVESLKHVTDGEICWWDIDF